MSDSQKINSAPVSQKRTVESISTDSQDGDPPSKKAKPLGPSQSFAEDLQYMTDNDLSLTGPHAGLADLNKALVFQQVDAQCHSEDIALVFGITQDGVRVLVHITNLSTLPRKTYSVSIVQRFLCHYKITAMSWMELPVGAFQLIEEPETLSYNQTEVTIRHEDIVFRGQQNESMPLRILSFDIETRVPPNLKFTPYHQTAEMPVIQIGNIMQMGERSYRTIFTLKGCAEISGAHVRSFPDEVSMLLAWRQFVVKSDPDLITGYNIARFDFVYLLLRAEALHLSAEFSCLGRLKGSNARALKVAPAPKIFRAWKDAPVLDGRLQLDVYQYVQEKNARGGSRTKSCKLDDIASKFLNGLSKEDLPFELINGLQDGTNDDRKRLAVYCLKDAYLPLMLLNCPELGCLDEAIEAARREKYLHLPFGAFLRMGRNQLLGGSVRTFES